MDLDGIGIGYGPACASFLGRIECLTCGLLRLIICQFVCQQVRCAKTAERIDVLFGVETQRNIVLDGNLYSSSLVSMRPLSNYFGQFFLNNSRDL